MVESEESAPPVLTARFEEALVYAARLHSTQTRRGSRTPYLSHLLAVSALVLEAGGDEDEAIAALLHDAIEDQGQVETREEIRRRFGERVVRIVEGCTDAWSMPKPPWRARKERYLDHLHGASSDVRLVSAADKLHNVRALLADYQRDGESLWGRFNGGKEGTLWYYRAVVEALRAGGGGLGDPLTEELDRYVCELERAVLAR